MKNNFTRSKLYAGVCAVLVLCMSYTVNAQSKHKRCRLYPRIEVTVDSCSVDFKDASTAGTGTTITGWLWDFGDGNTSTAQNPSYTYPMGGSYKVLLTITGLGPDSTVCERTVCKRIKLKGCGNDCYARPYFSYRDSCLTASFRDLSYDGHGTEITDWSWDFGDGGTSNLEDPQHVYGAEGTYTVCLTVTAMNTDSSTCTRIYCKDVRVKDCSNAPCRVKPYFKYHRDTCMTYSFAGHVESIPGTTITGWSWSFGDGGTSNLQNPTHTYTTPGVYNNVCLTVTAVGGDGSQCERTYCRRIEVRDCGNDACKVRPAFYYRDSCLTAQFNDHSYASSGTTITGWDWDFGDGTTSNLEDPQHVYGAEGIYDVCLTVTAMNPDSTTCSRIYCKRVEVKDCSNAPCRTKPYFKYNKDTCLTFSFNGYAETADGTTITGWLWNFGDGTSSTLQNPTHTYTTPGVYNNVCLTVTAVGGDGSQCEKTYCRTVEVRDCGNDHCNVRPAFTHRDSCLAVSFYDYSDAYYGSNVIGWDWSFGDGSNSNLEDPQHTYAAEGAYDVCLTVTVMNKDSSTCTRIYCKRVEVDDCSDAPCHVRSYFKYDRDTCQVMNFYDESYAWPGTTITGWSWDFGDGDSSGTQNPTHTYQDGGKYTVCLTVSGVAPDGTVCSKRECRRVYVPDCAPKQLESMAAPEQVSGITIVPNPAIHNARIGFVMEEEGQANVTVYDLQGKSVAVIHDGYMDAGSHQVEWSIGVPPGVYMVIVRTGSSVSHQRVVVR
ncbi:MAG: PKD domain-containing protein [Flavobacteriales bacterium]|nr:PKD domain-containing protein [Flavobacteriales bacterium]